MIAPEIVTCLAEGRQPTVPELCRVADYIEQDLDIYASAFTWGDASQVGSVHLINMRLALVALAGYQIE